MTNVERTGKLGVGDRSLESLSREDKDVRTILDNDVRASHKIQVNFGPGRSGVKDFKAMVTLWESGKFFHGGGDGQIYSCMDHRVFNNDATTSPSALPLMRTMSKERTDWGCGHPITGADIRGPVARCPGCKNLIQIKFLTGQMPFNGSVVELAELVAIVFHKLKDDADIYCKYDRTDIRFETQKVREGVERAHQLRGLFIYPLFRILQDLGSGASLEGRFRAFFLA
jgi:hypothetical protein